MRKPNQKRKIAPVPLTDETRDELTQLSKCAVYTGNPAHKRNPGDFGLKPPAGARGDKNLCEPSEVFSRKEATKLLRKAIGSGLVSVSRWEDWPQIVWAVAKNGVVVEAKCERDGKYHGFSLPEDDPLVPEIRRRWQEI